ncbi:MAG: hypothetical protein AB1730_27270 [Myxococcota bacterium]
MNERNELNQLRARLGGKTADEVQAILEAQSAELDRQDAALVREGEGVLREAATTRSHALAWGAAALVFASGLVSWRASGDDGFVPGAVSLLLGTSALSLRHAFVAWARRRTAGPPTTGVVTPYSSSRNSSL